MSSVPCHDCIKVKNIFLPLDNWTALNDLKIKYAHLFYAYHRVFYRSTSLHSLFGLYYSKELGTKCIEYLDVDHSLVYNAGFSWN
jgi:hypothetical protein